MIYWEKKEVTAVTEVYIARVDALRNDALFAARYAELPDERKAKVDALRHAADKRLSLGAWLLLAAALQKCGVTAPRLLCGENGKPYLVDHPELHFSLSHSGEAVMCAVSDSAVGCDVEKIGERKTTLAARFFHPAEQAMLAAAPADTQRTLFYRIWTAKESFAKCTGQGIRGMRDLCVVPSGTVQCAAGEYYIKEVEFDGYAACVCTADAQVHIDELPNFMLY